MRWQRYLCTVRRFTSYCPQHRFVKHKLFVWELVAKIGKFRISTDLWDFLVGWGVCQLVVLLVGNKCQKRILLKSQEVFLYSFSDSYSTSPAEHLTPPLAAAAITAVVCCLIISRLENAQKGDKISVVRGKKETK